MDENVLKQNIVDIGLTENESLVYLSALRVGMASASKIAKNAGLNRVTTYGILEKLSHRGLIQPVQASGIQNFNAIHPDIFVERARQKVQALEKSLPDLRKMMSEYKMRPNVRFFEGISELKKAYAETLKSQTDILSYANSKNIRDHWVNYDLEYVTKRQRKKIFLRGLAPDDSFGEAVKAEDKIYYRETRLLKSSEFEVENEVNIFNNTMFIASFQPHPFAILIESKAVADTQRQIFELLWRSSKA